MYEDLARTLRASAAGSASSPGTRKGKSQLALRRVVAGLPVLAFLLLQGCSALPPPKSADADRAHSTLVVVRRGWHIDVGFAAAEVGAPLDAIGSFFAGNHYLLFGFGDKHYLVAKRQSFPQMLGALWPGEGMMLVTALEISPEEAFGGAEEVIRLAVSVREADAAQEFIWNSFLRPGTAPTVYASGPYPGSAFFLSADHYSAFHTCNTWAAEVLQAAGLPVRKSGVMFAGQLWSQVRRIDAAQHGQVSAHATRASAFALRH